MRLDWSNGLLAGGDSDSDAGTQFMFKLLSAATATTSGTYSEIMQQECGKKKLKPVCTAELCRNDTKALFIGKPHLLDEGEAIWLSSDFC